MFVITIVAPTGVPSRIDTKIPTNAQITETMADEMQTALKVRNTRMDDNDGKTISAETSREPTKRIEIEMTHAVRTAIIVSYSLALPPVA